LACEILFLRCLVFARLGWLLPTISPRPRVKKILIVVSTANRNTEHDTAAAGLLVWAKCIYLGQSLGAEEADFD
jgi:hypothetical protein